MMADSAKPFFVSRQEHGVTILAPGRERSVMDPFPAAKAPGETRVFLVGESVAQRLNAAEFSARLGARVVNCGMGAYTSDRVRGVMSAALAQRPDAVILMTGNNDGRAAEGGWYPAYRANLFLRRSWSWRLVQDRLAELLRRRDDRAARDARFERNLRSMLREARSAGVPVVVATLPANLRDFPPLGELPIQTPGFLAAWLNPSVAAFRSVLAEAPGDPAAHFGLARALAATGDLAGAAPQFEAAVETDFPDRCAPSRNALIRRVAAEEGATVADLEELFRARAPARAPGWEAFVDGVHWRHGLDAAAEDALSRALHKPAQTTPPAPGRWSPAEARELALLAVSQALQTQVLEERVVAGFMQADEADPKGLRVLLADEAAAESAFARSEWTRSLTGRVRAAWPAVLAHAGEAYARRGEKDRALAVLREAARRDPSAGLPALLVAKLLRTEEAWNAVPPDTRERAMAVYYRDAFDKMKP